MPTSDKLPIYPPAHPVWSVPCPSCHAREHATCTTIPGKQGPRFLDLPHARRIEAATRAQFRRIHGR
jgi:hypothetical protein